MSDHDLPVVVFTDEGADVPELTQAEILELLWASRAAHVERARVISLLPRSRQPVTFEEWMGGADA